MGSRSCCENEGLNRGAWSAIEDEILTNYISIHGEGKWRNISINAGLKRCCKSCRLRWLNYLKPGIKRGNITPDEEDMIIRLHKLLGNRWKLIADRLLGRTDNEIKNHWNSNIRKRLQDGHPTQEPHFEDQRMLEPSSSSIRRHEDRQKQQIRSYVVRPKATRCTKVVIPEELQNIQQNKNILDADCQIFSDLEPLHYPQQQNGGEPILSPNWNDNLCFHQWNLDEGTSN